MHSSKGKEERALQHRYVVYSAITAPLRRPLEYWEKDTAKIIIVPASVKDMNNLDY